MLDVLDELGISESTIVVYSTDNGPHYNTWPDAAITPWRSEKNSNWEGAYRVPCFVRWPGKFEAGRTLTGIMSHQEWLPTLVAAAGEPGIVEKPKDRYDADGKHFKVHVDGYDALRYLLGESDESPRDWFFYTSDDGLITAIRYGDWKAVFYEQRAKGMALWAEPFVPLRLPKIFNLRRDPFEHADENANIYWDWVLDHIFVTYPMQALAAEQIQIVHRVPTAAETRCLQPGFSFGTDGRCRTWWTSLRNPTLVGTSVAGVSGRALEQVVTSTMTGKQRLRCPGTVMGSSGDADLL